jgi:anti-anti-sigma factor
MGVAITEDGNLVTLMPDGPLEEAVADSLRTAAAEALRDGKKRFVLNLQKVGFARSIGLEVIVQLAREVAAIDGRLGLVGVGEDLAAAFRATRLDRRLAIFDSTVAALSSMRLEA